MIDPIRAALERSANELDIAENALRFCSFHNSASRAKQAARAARAALSQPEPEGPTDEELYELWEADGEGDFQECRSFARDVLARWGRPHSRWTADRAQPEPAGLSDEELLQIAAKTIEPYDDCGIGIDEYEAETDCAVEAYGSELIAFARAAIAADRAQRQPEPVPTVEGEVGELIKCLRIRAASLSKVGANLSQRGDAIYFTRAADLLEQRQPVEPLPGEVEG